MAESSKKNVKSEDFWMAAEKKAQAYQEGTDEVGHFLRSLKVEEEETVEV
jgi:hypothetical protein